MVATVGAGVVCENSENGSLAPSKRRMTSVWGTVLSKGNPRDENAQSQKWGGERPL